MTPEQRDAAKKTLTPPRDRRVPIVEMDGLLVQTIHIITDLTSIPRVEITRKGGPAVSTLDNWAKHQVRSPLLRTIRGALRACGYSLVIQDPDGLPLAPFDPPTDD
jgi:hypothetical protein